MDVSRLGVESHIIILSYRTRVKFGNLHLQFVYALLM